MYSYTCIHAAGALGILWCCVHAFIYKPCAGGAKLETLGFWVGGGQPNSI